MKINELEDLLGVSKATIRYYEDQGLVTPPRMENGYRDEEVQLFQKIIVLRKLGLGIQEIRDLIDGKAELHDVLAGNVERLRTRQGEISSAIELCGKIEAETADFASLDSPADFASLDSPKYLKHIYENEQQGRHFAETKEISPRQLNLAITLLAALGGIAIPQNNRYSKHANSPIPADIRANKKEGEEYDTIGDVLRKGDKRKPFVIAAVVILAAFLLMGALFIWGGLGGAVKYGIDYSKSGISGFTPDADEAARIIAVDPEAKEVIDNDDLLRFHTEGDLLLKLWRSEDGKWTELDELKINEKEGYLFITGGPAADIKVHTVNGDTGNAFSVSVNDSRYNDEGEGYFAIACVDQLVLDEERVIALGSTGDAAWTEEEELLNGTMSWEDIAVESAPDGCYAVTVQDAK